MKAIYIEAFAGISGNMLLGALLDAGVPIDYLAAEMEKLHLGEYELINKRVDKCGIAANYFNVVLPDEHQHDVIIGQQHTHTHAEQHHHEHIGVGHHHEHDIGCEQFAHNHEAPEAALHHHHEHRNLHDIAHIIEHSDLSAEIKSQSLRVFTALAEAEARVHGKTVDEVHFHEVGAIDTIIDIAGCVLALQYLGIEKIFVSNIHTGSGFVKCAHGLMPVPAPATAELLQGLRHSHGNIDKELTTPTGAALMKVLAVSTNDLPQGFTGSKIAYGAGTWDLEIPNVLRINIGEWEAEAGADLLVAECNIDDMNGELYPYVQERLLQAGALDCWLTPIIMKKGRPAQTLSVLLTPQNLDKLTEILLTETTSLGVRYYAVHRHINYRKFTTVELPEGEVRIKYAQMGGRIVNIAPEFEDCKALALKSGRSLKTIMQAATAAAEAQLEQ
ncbi:nickel pincer cofactor biosynthesis protein LarC [uncultured Phascolarctobacterium sp.]|uniref:nickel pincer cofactor biosynthesis protein LarC n=1 Tax=uncultured Phascolarctobacterium sp. TaxID=512296 RepID=UPI0025DFD994|nr:nickel pincer cofactor biosynthesis protein LarC [uncultured Phascolarctobacterium sp.]